MFMSLFSSVDAVCAEAFGHKVSLSWSPANKEEKKQGGVLMPAAIVSHESKAATNSSSSSSVDGFKKGKEGISSLSSSSSSSSSLNGEKLGSQQERRPRFAVELDGIHCFETIIPY